MPFNPAISDFGGKFTLEAGRAIADDIRKWREQREQTEKEIGFSDTVMKAAHVDGRVSDEEYTDYLKMPENKKHSAALGQMANVADDFKRQQLADQILARKEIAAGRNQTWSPDPEVLQKMESAGYLYGPNSARSGQYVNTRKKSDEDSWKKLDADTKAITGAGLGDWNRAQNHRVENGQFMADLAGSAPPPGTDPAVAAFLSKPARKLSAPVSEYQTLLRRYKALSSGDPAPPEGATLPDPGSATNLDALTGQQPLPGATSQPLNPSTPQPSASPTAPVINNEQDYAAVPAGQLYVDGRDGKLKRKKAAQQ